MSIGNVNRYHSLTVALHTSLGSASWLRFATILVTVQHCSGTDASPCPLRTHPDRSRWTTTEGVDMTGTTTCSLSWQGGEA